MEIIKRPDHITQPDVLCTQDEPGLSPFTANYTFTCTFIGDNYPNQRQKTQGEVISPSLFQALRLPLKLPLFYQSAFLHNYFDADSLYT